MYKTLTIIHTTLKTDNPKYMSNSITLKLKNNLRSFNKKLLKQDITSNFPQLWNKLPALYITLPLLLLTSYQPYYYYSPPLHIHLYLIYFLYTLSPIHFSHIHNVHCKSPSHEIPSHFLIHITTIITLIIYLF